MQKHCHWHRLETADQVAEAVYSRVLSSASEAIAERGRFKLVLAGGSTPEKIYRMLADADADWSNWFIYHGDERCLPVDHMDRNSVMAAHAWLDHVAIPATQVFNIPAEFGPEIGAERYRPIVAGALPFDLVLLGMGEDGHTASLFPGHVHPEKELTHAVLDSPKPPPERVSISAGALSSTRRLMFIVTGSSKRSAVKQWRDGGDLPVASIDPENGVEIYLDNAAEPA